MNEKLSHLIWIDLEMTGLDPLTDHILEIATLITDAQLQIVAEGPSIAIHHPPEVLAIMNDWCQKQHGQSGLIARVQASQYTLQAAEKETLAFVQQYVGLKASPMCGNTICQDRRFLNRWMPTLEAYFHYRHLDVSTVKELARMWAPDLFKNFTKDSRHLAMDDIKESIEELRYYREHFFKIAETSAKAERS